MLIGKGENQAELLPEMGNRHGLISGATGTGKTVTLRVMSEQFSKLGVPVFTADVKGDLSGLISPGEEENIKQYASDLELDDFTFTGYPTVFWDLYGEKGHPIRVMVHTLGPLFMSRILNLNLVQQGVMHALWKMTEDRGKEKGKDIRIVNLEDIKNGLKYLNDYASKFSVIYGNVNFTSVGAIQRSIIEMENQNTDSFFNAPELDLQALFQVNEKGYGLINILQADTLINNPKLYSTFLLWLMSDLYERLPEVGDLEKPKLVLFFDEAHLMFQDCSPILLQKIEQIIRLIRSKGVGVYFVTQNPLDIPDMVLGQLGNKVQHALRAFTPRDQKTVRAVGETFRPNPRLGKTQDAIMNLRTGEAVVSFLQSDGSPSVAERVCIRPPESSLKSLTDLELQIAIESSPLKGKYDTPQFIKKNIITKYPETNMFEDALYDIGRRVGRHAGYVLTNTIVRGMFNVLKGGRSTIGK